MPPGSSDSPKADAVGINGEEIQYQMVELYNVRKEKTRSGRYSGSTEMI